MRFDDDTFDPEADADPITDSVMEDEIGGEPVQATELPIGKELYEFLCGTAGTGKTYLAKLLKETAPGAVELAATTGIAAVNLGEGTTIHALLRFFDTASLRDAFRVGSLQAQIRRLRRGGLRRVILDEVSMLSGESLTILAMAFAEVNDAALAGQIDEDDLAVEGEEVRPRKEPAQPVGLTLVGDFGQLQPVPDKDPLTQKSIPCTLAFQSPEWKRFAANTTKLEKIWRQDDLDFVQALHAIRRGDVVSALKFFTAERFSSQTDENFEGTTIYAKNAEVDRHNMLKLAALPGAPMTYQAKLTGKRRSDWKQIPDQLDLKQGALVMMLANYRTYVDEMDTRGTIVYANGDLGTLMRPSGSYDAWLVKLQRTGGVVSVYPVLRDNTIPLEPGRKKEIKEEVHKQVMVELREQITTRLQEDWRANNAYNTLAVDALPPVTTDEDIALDYQFVQREQALISSKITEDGKKEIVGTIQYMPMRAAYGCTVHKTQGLTLDKVQINIRDPFFAHPGMLFVALSRARSAAGLRIVGNQTGFMQRCKIDPRVQPWL